MQGRTDFGTPGTWGAPVDIQIAPDGNVAYQDVAEFDVLRSVDDHGVGSARNRRGLHRVAGGSGDGW